MADCAVKVICPGPVAVVGFGERRHDVCLMPVLVMTKMLRSASRRLVGAIGYCSAPDQLEWHHDEQEGEYQATHCKEFYPMVWCSILFRGDPARSQRGTSHGLGLAIVKAIVEMHGGQVAARAGISSPV